MARDISAKKGFLSRLLHNQAGNVLAMTAAALIPLLGLIGGGIDMSRIYLVKARLQQACDAGVLAGRKKMAGGSWAANSGAANTVAVNMFNANFQSGAYGTSGLTKTFTENAGKVTGTASVTVPMAVMQVFGNSAKTLNITCDAEMRIPNTDVMFVLDTTGSMAWTNSGDTAPKIDGLKKAVRCFYEALAKIDTIADCGSTPSGGNGTVQLRFGFVPYATNVNVGRLLNNSWMADNWYYQSRQAVTKTAYGVIGYNDDGVPYIEDTDITNQSQGTWTTYATYSNIKRSECKANQPANSASAVGAASAPYGQNSWIAGNGNQVLQWFVSQDYSGVAYRRTWTEVSNNRGPCLIEQAIPWQYTEVTEWRKENTPIYGNGPVFDKWSYKRVQFNVGGLKAGGSNWNASITAPVGGSGANATIPWDGCIEERETVVTTVFSPIPAGAKDLDIDLVPTGDTTTQWGPALPGLVWGRYDEGSGQNSYADITTASDLWRNNDYYCPEPARKLQIYNTSTDFDTYVGTLTPDGNTYHDIGLLWGARLMSPTGLFASENAYTPNGGEIQRHLIFMTDGDTVTDSENYTAYGVAWWDRRQTPSGTAPSNSDLTTQVNSRFLALCSAIKNKNITLWVISYGAGVSGAAQTNLQNCASPNRYYSAANSAALIDNFKSIASQISALRLTS